MALRLCLFMLASQIAIAPAGQAAGSGPSLPKRYSQKIGHMPDLCQTDKAFASLPGGGRQHCAAAAVVNVLVGMDLMGYENLIPGLPRETGNVLAVMKQLGSPAYMNIGKKGVGPVSVMRALGRYVRERKYTVSFQSRGWRRAGRSHVDESISPEWLKEGILGRSNTVLNVGWYKLDAEAAQYERVGGHYMSIVGYSTTVHGTTFHLHDPARRSGKGKITHAVSLVPVRKDVAYSSTLRTKDGSPSLYMLDGVVVKSIADIAVIDCAIRFEISRLSSDRAMGRNASALRAPVSGQRNDQGSTSLAGREEQIVSMARPACEGRPNRLSAAVQAGDPRKVSPDAAIFPVTIRPRASIYRKGGSLHPEAGAKGEGR